MATHTSEHRKHDEHYEEPGHLTPGRLLVNGVKAVGDLAILPGASLVAEGKLRSATLHVAAGFLARALFGPIGWFVVGADAYSKSVTGKNLYEHFFEVDRRGHEWKFEKTKE